MDSGRKRTRRLSERMAAADGRAADKPVMVRCCTIDVRLQQLEDECVAQSIRVSNTQQRLADSVQQNAELLKELESIRGELEKQKKSARHWRAAARRWETGQAIMEHAAEVAALKQQLAEAKEEAETAWNQCRATEREKRRLKASATLELSAAQQETKNEVALRELYHDRLEALKVENSSLSKSISATTNQATRGGYAQLDPCDRSREAVKKQNARLKSSLTEFLNEELLGRHGGVPGELAKSMFVSFFAENTSMLEHIMTELQIYEAVERQTVAAIQNLWTLDVCAAVFIHGDMSLAGYQAVLNILSKTYEFADDRFKPILLPHGTEMAKLCSRNSLQNHLRQVSEFFGMEVLDNGRAAAVDIRLVIVGRLKLMKSVADSSQEHPLPSTMVVSYICILHVGMMP